MRLLATLLATPCMRFVALAGFADGPFWLVPIFILIAASLWPIGLILAGGWHILGGVALLILDAFLIVPAGRWAVHFQRRLRLPDFLAGFGVLGTAFVVCGIANSVILTVIVLLHSQS